MASYNEYRRVQKTLKKLGFTELPSNGTSHRRFIHPSGHVQTISKTCKHASKALQAIRRDCRKAGIEIKI